ncbi:MAG TPA: DNA polymerase II, partial [Ignisphaera sp.]|nr:DNA polymerase II [Ignisphaera sp.]
MSERITVYVLDTSYEVYGSEPHIIIWGIDENGNRVVLRDRRFRPYFYAVLDPSYYDKANEIASLIKQLSKPRSPIINVSPIERRYFGKPMKVFKIVTAIPEYVREYREDVKKIPGIIDVLEADIRFTMRYLIDNDILPNTWHEFKVVSRNKNPDYRVDYEYEILEINERVDSIKLPNLRMVAFDIEVYN